MPFLLLSLFAQGTMPVAGPDNRLTVVLCTEDGLVQMAMSADGVPLPQQDHVPHGGCDWAANAQPALAGGLPLPAALPEQPAQSLRFGRGGALAERLGLLMAALARGPPLSV